MVRQSHSATTTRHSYRSARTQLLRIRRELISGLPGLSHTTSQFGTGGCRKSKIMSIVACEQVNYSGKLSAKRSRSTSQPNQLQRANDPILPAVAVAVKICIWNLSSKCLSFDTADFRLLGNWKKLQRLTHVATLFSTDHA